MLKQTIENNRSIEEYYEEHLMNISISIGKCEIFKLKNRNGNVIDKKY